MTKGILHGVRVLDLSRMLSGPYCTMMLADHGAEVIKIESPFGDTARGNGPFRDDDPEHDWAGYFVSLNRNKKSVVLDLKEEADKDAFRSLAASADIIVENFRPGVMERLGLGYETLAAQNPALVYGAIRGFGDPRSGESPYASWPSYDVVAQAMGGLMDITGPNADTPTKVGPGVGDIFSGLMMSFGIIAALRQAEATGVGQFVDVAMYDAIISLCERSTYLQDFSGTAPKAEGNGHPFLAPFGLFPASDGNVALGIVDDAFWNVLAGVIGTPDLAKDTRFTTRAARAENAAVLNTLVGDWTQTLSKAQLAEKLGGAVPFGPMNTAADIRLDPHVAKRDMMVDLPHGEPDKDPWVVAGNPLKFSQATPPVLKTPPRLGEHTEHYLSEMPNLPTSDTDKRALRSVFGSFATGVTVVTTRQEDGTPRGFTANSFTSVSLDPPLLLVCIAKSAHSCATFCDVPHFAVNILSEDQKAVSGLFASQAPDKFDQVDWQSGAANVPLLDGGLANLVCEQEKIVDAGDHIILMGRVIAHQVSEQKPLGYFQGNYFSVGLEDDLVSAASRNGRIEIGAILARGAQILLRIDAEDTVCVPKCPSKEQSLTALKTHFDTLGLRSEMNFLYAVYHDTGLGHHGVYYHGTVVGRAPQGHKFFDLDDIPLSKVTRAAERSMLARYQDEFRHGQFGIYQGDEHSGRVHHVTAAKKSKH
ncbi:MAG: CoA transferase [Amylibacter sp.]|jgi:(E)-2-((N-methylformamido)methylene)succinate hydrolase|nr:CoA transferase [Amylibacter sp.]